MCPRYVHERIRFISSLSAEGSRGSFCTGNVRKYRQGFFSVEEKKDPLTERKNPLGPPDYESRKVIFYEILLFVITLDYQCFTKLSSSLNLKKSP